MASEKAYFSHQNSFYDTANSSVIKVCIFLLWIVSGKVLDEISSPLWRSLELERIKRLRYSLSWAYPAMVLHDNVSPIKARDLVE